VSHTYEVMAMIEGTLRDVRDTKAIAPCSALAGHPWVSKEKSLIINNNAPVDRGSPKSFLRKGPLVFLIFRRGGRANAIQIVSGFQTEARSLLRSDMRAEKYLSSGETRL
jgi:hypothetical protein